jgi:hypothetical protein
MDVSNSIEIAKPLKEVWKILADDFDKAYTFKALSKHRSLSRMGMSSYPKTP